MDLFSRLRKHLRIYLSLALQTLALLALAQQTSYAAQADHTRAGRVVVIKVDGLSQDVVEHFVRQRDPRTGKSVLPWINHLFYERGTRLRHFYTRGFSLSGPSWSLLDTGQHLQIKGNVEYDRLTLRTYDYLNLFQFYFSNAFGSRVDSPGVEVLDEIGIPLLADAYHRQEQFHGFQLYQRGVKWTVFQRGLTNRFTSRRPRELFDEWVTGFETNSIFFEQIERELVKKLNNPRVRYCDIYTPHFDHVAHNNNTPAAQLAALREIDALVGRVWAAIQNTPAAPETVLAVVSDHGMSTDERVYSQGYNLVRFLNGSAGGAHHVVTKRRLMNNYSLKGANPFSTLLPNAAVESFYLKGRAEDYPTALLDFDGNERAAVHLRDSDLNTLHILLQQLRRSDLPPALRRAATDAFFSTIDARRARWSEALGGLREELGALRRLIESRRALAAAQKKKWTQEERDEGLDQAARRVIMRLETAVAEERAYAEYARTLENLLALRREGFDPARLKVEDVIAPRAMGESNTPRELQNYVVGLAPGGLQLSADGSLDAAKSFARVDYFAALSGLSVRNNVQPGVGSRPVDFVATRVPAELLHSPAADEAVWLYGGRDSQALILGRKSADGRLLLSYVPVEGFTQDERGRMSFRLSGWRAGLPLKIFEDANLQAPADEGERARWLGEWHTEYEWLRALHLTKYSNAVVGLYEHFARHESESLNADAPGLTPDERLIRRFRKRQRILAEADFVVHAGEHWNFDVKDFNPGGNHGSFYRASTLSALMMAGGERTGIPRGLAITEPYDNLSFMPTILTLMGQAHEGVPTPALRELGFRPFPGRIIKELFTNSEGQSVSHRDGEMSP